MKIKREDIRNIAIIAHVDHGKTTLVDQLLRQSGVFRANQEVVERVMDSNDIERERGITIFSKQAQLKWKNENEEINMTLLDTPGHVDFSAEMERTLQVLDYGILVVSGSDGVQGHTETLWKLLKRYNIPTFIFVNKMDLAGSDKNHIMENLKSRLDTNCVDFSDYEKSDDNFLENVATCDENALENYMDTGEISNEEITNLIAERKVFPCFFGSALKLDGIELLLNAMANLTQNKSYPDEFGARVYKISRDSQGNRLTHMKVTGGVLKVKDVINDEKVNQIRIYSGNKFETKDSVKAGELSATVAQDSAGIGAVSLKTMVETVKAGKAIDVNATPETIPVDSYIVTKDS